jgi:hypothetical protein
MSEAKYSVYIQRLVVVWYESQKQVSLPKTQLEPFETEAQLSYFSLV